MEWIKSNFCNTDQATGNCFEASAGIIGEGVLMRNSTSPGFYIAGSREEFAAFLAGAKAGEFDHLI